MSLETYPIEFRIVCKVTKVMTMRFLSCLILLSGASIVAHSQDFYRDSNGVTIKCENASPDDTGRFTYLVVLRTKSLVQQQTVVLVK